MIQGWYEECESPQSPDKFQRRLRHFHNCGLFAQPTYVSMRSKPPGKIDISPDDDKKAPYQPLYRMSPNEDAELQRQLEKA